MNNLEELYKQRSSLAEEIHRMKAQLKDIDRTITLIHKEELLLRSPFHIGDKVRVKKSLMYDGEVGYISQAFYRNGQLTFKLKKARKDGSMGCSYVGGSADFLEKNLIKYES